MLAGYLPFDDDPANPEGDNINLLYKYIVSTPLTFPEYVTPHARDLLKRILVPDPRKRADLFEVARHSWLADYSHVVGFITSSNTNSNEAQPASAYPSRFTAFQKYFQLPTNSFSEDTLEQQPGLARSASVREPGKAHGSATPAHGGLTAKREQINQPPSEKAKTSRDNKRRTVQVEYVAPQSQTARGEASPPAAESSKARAKDPQVPPTDGYQSSTSARPSRSAGGSGTTASTRPGRDPQRSVSDYTAFGTAPTTSNVRPSTGGTLGGGSRLPSRGNSYGQPSAAAVVQTQAEGRFSQPKGKQYTISTPYNQPEASSIGEPSIGQPSTQRGQSVQLGPSGGPNAKGHKRSNTVTETLGRVTSMFSGRQPSYAQDPKSSYTSQNSYANHPEEKKQKSYPPTSMAGPMSNEGITAGRQSTESSRRTSFGFSRKNTNNSGETKASRRFSLLPSSLSKTFSSQRESMPASTSYNERRGSSARPRAGSRPGMAFGRGESRSPSQSTTNSNIPGFYDGQHDSNSRIRNPTLNAAGPSSAPPNQTQFDNYPAQAPIGDEKFPNPRDPHPSTQNRSYRQQRNNSEASETLVGGPSSQPQSYPQRTPYPHGMGDEDTLPPQHQQRKGVLQKSRKFADAYDDQSGNKGSTGSSKKVMDFFRRMGRQRTGSR